jgi:EmrB/QacA subfamily drug resistance transporter
MDRKWWTLVAVCVGTFMLLLDVTIVMVVLPNIQRALGASFQDLQWTVDAYALTLAALLLTAGSLADRLGRRRLYVAGVVLFTAASLLCGAASSSLFLIVMRGVQGIGGAMMFATALALLGNEYRGSDRATAFAVWGALTGVAVAVGPLVGGALTEWLSWRWIFFVNAPFGVAAIAIALLRVPESREQRSAPPDWAGFVIFSGALAALVFGLIRGNAAGWSSAQIIGSLAGSLTLFGAFVVVERTVPVPMFDLSLFRKPAFLGGSISAFAVQASVLSLLLYLVIYLQDVLGHGPLGTGIRLLTLSGAIFVAGGISGRLSGRVPPRVLLGTGLACAGVGLLLMRGLDANSTWTHLLAGLIVSGVGVGLINPALASTAVDVVARERAGMASGINSTFRQVGIATGIAALGAVFQTQVKDHVVSGASRLALDSTIAHRLAAAVTSGHAPSALGHATPAQRAAIAEIARGSFATALNEIFLIAAVVAFAGAILALTLVRSKDFIVAAPEAAIP